MRQESVKFLIVRSESCPTGGCHDFSCFRRHVRWPTFTTAATCAPLEALHAHGVPCATAYGLVPGSLARCAGYAFYRWDVCVRATAVVGVAGAAGLGRSIEERLRAFDYAGLAATPSALARKRLGGGV